MDLSGPMRVASINGKKYIRVIVDDYSRYTWVYFLHSKDENPEIIKKFIAQAQLNYKAKVYKIRTDNGTEFKKVNLKAHYEKLGIMQQFSTARTPHQNGVVKRRNRTLVEAARTMLIFSQLPEFLWAEAVATSCFTQNWSIIHTRYSKTPYELLCSQKPNVEYFHVFSSLCYPTNDHDDLGKIKPKADCVVFIEPMNTPSKEDLDNLFGLTFEEYFGKKSSDTPINFAAQPTQLHEDLPSTSLISVEEHKAHPIKTKSDEQTSLISLLEADELHQEDSADFDGNSQFVSYNPISYEAIESSSMALEPSNVQNFHQKHGLDECVSMSTPMATERLDADLQGTPTDQTTYHQMIGGIMYLRASQPAIAYATFICARYQDSGFELIAYSDVDHAGFIWMHTQLLDYGYKYNRISMYCNSKSAIAISCNPVQHSKTKQIDIRYHFIKEHIEKGTVELYFVSREYQLAVYLLKLFLKNALSIWFITLEVIVFGDSYKAPPEETGKGPASESSARKKGRTVAITTEDMQKRKNDVKIRTTLMLALPNEYQQRNQLKLQYGNFKAKGSETLEQTFNRLQAIVSHLEFMDVETEQDDLNKKFLTSLAPEWLIGKAKVHTANVSTASIQVSTASTDVAATNLIHDTICAYKATQSNGSQIKYEDITQIDEDDIEEMDLKWNIDLLSMRADRFWKKIGHFARECRAPRSQDKGKRESYKQGPKEEDPAPKALMAIDGIRWDWSYMANEEENHALVADDEVLTEFALMAKSHSSLDNEVYDDSYCSKSCRKNTENLNTKISKLNKELSDCETYLYNYKRGLSQVEARLVEFKENEVKFYERIRVLKRDVKIRDNKIKYSKNELKQIKKEKESLDNKLTCFENALKDLDNLLGSQRSDKNKNGLPEFVDDTVTDYSRPTPSIDATKCNKSELQSSNFFVFEHGESTGSIMSKPMIKFVKENDCPRVIKINNTKNTRKSTVKYAETYRNISKGPKVRGNQRNWNNLKSKQLEKDFLMQNKACFKCGYFDHLASNCGVWVDTGETWPKNNYTYKSMTPIAILLKPGTIPIVVSRPNMNVAQPKMTSFAKIVHLNVKRAIHRITLMIKDIRTVVALGREFKNHEMNEFFTKKGIRREFSNVRTPQQNRVAERKNRTLIEAVRTMLADAKLPVSFWAKAVNTAYHLGKFDAKGDEGYFVWYSLSSKAFRVFNKRTKKVEENLHVDFLENKLIKKGSGLNWLFVIDTLTSLMNYVPVVVAGTSSTNISEQDCTADVSKSSGISNSTATSKVPSADQVEPAVSLTVESDILIDSSYVPTICLDISPDSLSGPRLILKGDFSKKEAPSLVNGLTLSNRFEDTFGDTTNAVTLNEVKADLSNIETSIPVEAIQEELLQFKIQNVWVLVDCPKGVRPIATKWVFKNKKDERGIVIRNKVRLVAQMYTSKEGIDYEEVFVLVARIEAIRLFLAYALFMSFIVYQIDVKSTFLHGTIDEEVYVMQPLGFQDPEFPNRLYKVEKAMYGLHHDPKAWYVYVDDIIFGSSNPQLCREFEALMHDKFQMSDMDELTFFLGLQVLQNKDGILLSQDKYVGDILKKFGYSDVRSANTPMDKKNPWGKDGPGKDVELHLYRSMIGSLMYITASRPDIMFVVCACARNQVTPKGCHLHVVKRIFRYLKGHPKLGLWYPKESFFDLVAYSDSDYGRATQDRKSTTRGCQFLGRRLISWQCKNHTIVATSTTEAEYVVAASGCRQVLWTQN
uniref:Putative ribonuclease H-like domain-containing protein n=1 Tax=Tanacetum cinerariifolium TaxID=118510 RepID=A0A6L2LTS2_TANCI|nr:putative ribonuclease H-like domain-containing protein [Tanacetum cinerariifolium]